MYGMHIVYPKYTKYLQWSTKYRTNLFVSVSPVALLETWNYTKLPSTYPHLLHLPRQGTPLLTTWFETNNHNPLFNHSWSIRFERRDTACLFLLLASNTRTNGPFPQIKTRKVLPAWRFWDNNGTGGNLFSLLGWKGASWAALASDPRARLSTFSKASAVSIDPPQSVLHKSDCPTNTGNTIALIHDLLEWIRVQISRGRKFF